VEAAGVLDQFTLDTFSPLLGQTFSLIVDGANMLPLELVEATDLQSSGRAPAADEARRTPFSLVFRGPSTPVAPQRIYPLEHSAIGHIELFLVPIGPDGQGMRYEAIFT